MGPESAEIARGIMAPRESESQERAEVAGSRAAASRLFDAFDRRDAVAFAAALREMVAGNDD